MVALVLSTLIVALVTSVFLVQNEFYSDAVKRSALQESVRSATLLVSSQLRGVASGGIVEAEPDSVTFRIPLVVGGVCRVDGSETYLLLPLDGEEIDGSEIAGYAVRDDSGDWSYTAATWASIYQSSGDLPAQRCASAGADTTGAGADFYRLDGLDATPALGPGDLVMLYREMTLKLGTSLLDGSSTALFAGQSGGTLTEFTSGLTAGSAFEYRFGGQTNWRNRVPGGNKNRIAAIRFSALGALEASRLGRDSLTFNLSVTVPLRNAN